MAKKKIQTVCVYSCSECLHHGKECPRCEATMGKLERSRDILIPPNYL